MELLKFTDAVRTNVVDMLESLGIQPVRQYPQGNPNGTNTVLVRTGADLQAMMETLRGKPLLYVDIETTGLDPYTSTLLLITIGDDTHTFVVVVPDILSGAEALLREGMRDLLTDQRSVKVIHNAAFDTKFFYHLYKVHTTPVFCTMIAEQLLTAGLGESASLKETVRRRFGIELDKEVRKTFIGKEDTLFTDEQLAYAAHDVNVLRLLYHTQRDLLERYELLPVATLEMALIPIVVTMEYGGVCINTDLLFRAIPYVEQQEHLVYQQLQRVAIESGFSSFILFDYDTYRAFPPGKLLQLARHLNITVSSLDRRELTDWDATHGTTEMEYLDYWKETQATGQQVYRHPFLQLLYVYKALQKLQGTYYRGMAQRLHPVTGRIHPRFIQCGASSTGRFSSTDPNFQNLPNHGKMQTVGLTEYDVRSLFVAPPGRVFIISDYSGIELAILAAFSQDEQLIYQIVQGDIHSYVAMSLYGDEITRVLGSPITPENRKKGHHKQVRDLFKPVSYAICYGSTGYNLYRVLNLGFQELGFHITRELTDSWVERWKKELFPRTNAFFEYQALSAVTAYRTESVLGRKRFWNEQKTRETMKAYRAAMREGMNQPIQSSSADMTKLAMVLTHHALDPQRGRIVASIHDELLVEVDEDYAEEAGRIVQECMEKAGYMLFPHAPQGLIRAEPKVSSCYDK